MRLTVLLRYVLQFIRRCPECANGLWESPVPAIVTSYDVYLRAEPFLKALERYNIEKDIASYVKKEFDKKYNPTWHCIVGRNFGAILHK